MSDFKKDNGTQYKPVTDEIFEYTKDFFDEGQDQSWHFLTKKTERMCAAIFLVTDFLPATDTFRATLRSKGLLLVETVYSTTYSLKDEMSGTLYSLFSEISALTEVGRIARMISPMNASILMSECNTLCSYIRENKNIVLSNTQASLHTSLFEVEVSKEKHTALSSGRSHGEQQKRHIKDNNSHYQNNEATPKIIIDKRHSNLTEEKGHTKGENREKQRDRRASILAVLQKKDRINIKDISQVVTDCSEKTLQRELLGLVAQGVLKKEGQRRWSTYMLAAR